MVSLNIVLEPSSPVSLQNQLRQRLVDAIYRGVLRPGSRLPSSRALAQRLNVSRNTVSLVYDALVSEGHLVSRPRSGIFVAPDLPGVRIATGTSDTRSRHAPAARAMTRESGNGFEIPANWYQYPYAFVANSSHAELLPVNEWREAVRMACTRHELTHPGPGVESVGDQNLIEQLRSKVLTIHGIVVDADQVVATMSVRHALHLVASVVVHRGTPVVLQEPAESGFRNWLRQRGAIITTLDPRLRQRLPQQAIVITSARPNPLWPRPDPAHLLAAVTEADGIVIEQYAPPSLLDRNHIAPALRASHDGDRVIYVGGLSPLVSCDTPLGIIVAPAMVARRLRRQHRARGTTPSAVIQRAWAWFISLGHYASALTRTSNVLEQRMEALRDALNHYLHHAVDIATLPGHSAYWVRLRQASDMDAEELAQRAARSGVLVQPLDTHDGRVSFLMGVAGMPEESIRPGVQVLARLLHGDLASTPQQLADEALSPLDETALKEAMSGITLVYNTVYGEPCTLEFHANGSMHGTSGQAGEDCDTGQWWIEDGRWFRRWERWAYGEAAGFNVVIDGDQLRWYDENGLLADMAVISRGNGRS